MANLTNALLNYLKPIKFDPPNLTSYLKQQSKLDLSNFRGQIEIPPSCRIDRNPLVDFLKSHPEITSVDISNHPEINNLLFSRFRQNLPNLCEMIINNTKVTGISGDQWLKYPAHNIKLIISGQTMTSFGERVKEYLDAYMSYHQDEELKLLSKFKKELRDSKSDTISRGSYIYDNSVAIIEIKKRAYDRYRAERSREYQQKVIHNQFIKDELIKSWESGQSKFAMTDAYKNGPKTFAEWPRKDSMAKEIYVLYLVVTELGLWDKMMKDPGDGGYMFSRLDFIDKINSHPAVDACGHSGASFGCSMRAIQYIAKYGWAKYCE